MIVNVQSLAETLTGTPNGPCGINSPLSSNKLGELKIKFRRLDTKNLEFLNLQYLERVISI